MKESGKSKGTETVRNTHSKEEREREETSWTETVETLGTMSRERHMK